jgi:hypothetical protein
MVLPFPIFPSEGLGTSCRANSHPDLSQFLTADLICKRVQLVARIEMEVADHTTHHF